jgi:hypothetical protein
MLLSVKSDQTPSNLEDSDSSMKQSPQCTNDLWSSGVVKINLGPMMERTTEMNM